MIAGQSSRSPAPRGKSELNIRLVVKEGEGYGPFTDFRYEVLTFSGK